MAEENLSLPRDTNSTHQDLPTGVIALPTTPFILLSILPAPHAWSKIYPD